MSKKLLTYGRHSNERIAFRLGELLKKDQNQSLEVYKWRLSYLNIFDPILYPLRMLETFLIKIIKRPTCVYDIHQTSNPQFKPVTAISPDWETIEGPSEWIMTTGPETSRYSTRENILGILDNMFGETKIIEVVDNRNPSNVLDSELETYRNTVLDVVHERQNSNIFELW